MLPPRLSILSLLLACALATNVSAAPILSIDVGGAGANGVVGLGDTVTVSLVGNEIPVGTDGNGLFGFGFSILYDGSLLSTTGATQGPLWTGTGFVDTRNDAGHVGILANRFFMLSGPSGNNILLATLAFTGLSVGTSPLTVGYYTGEGDNLLFDGSVLDGSLGFFESGSLHVVSELKVPEPNTALLVGLGLFLLGVRRRGLRLHRA